MNDFWRRIGGSDAISWPLLIITWPIITGSSLFMSGVPIGPDTGLLLTASGCAIALMLLWLFAAKYTLLRPARRRPMPVVTVLVFLLAVWLRAWLFDLLLVRWGVTEHSELLFRFLSSLPVTGGGLVMMAYLVSLARDFSTASSAYQRDTDEQMRLRTAAAEQVAEYRTQLAASIRAQLEGQLRGILADAPEQALRRIQETITDLVRPLSHHLVHDFDAVSAPSTSDAPQIRWQVVLRNSMAVNPFRPVLFAAWIMFLSLVSASLLGGLVVGLVYTLAVGAITLVAMLAGRWCWNRWWFRRSIHVRALWYSASWAVGAVGVAAFGGIWLNRASPLMLTQVMLAAVTGWVLALVASLHRSAGHMQARACEAHTELVEERARLEIELWQQRQTVGRVLHGPIQDAMSASSFRLAHLLAAGPVQPEQIAELQQSIVSRLALIEAEPAASRLLPEVLSEIAQLWEGLVEVEWAIAPAAERALTDSVATSTSAIEIIREACSNAVRHGRARHIRVDVSLVDGRILLCIENDGVDPDVAARPGLGSQLIAQLSLEHSLDRRDGRVVLHATLPLV